jgi:hypothetical protein
MNEETQKQTSKFTRGGGKLLILSLIAAAFCIYYFSNPKQQHYYDYTFRVADNMLRGAIAYKEKPPSWLNEFVPFDDNWYSVFPLGSVLTMIPFAFLKVLGFIREMPAAFISAFSAGAICFFLKLIASRYKMDERKRVLLVCGILFGTWMWTNLTFAGAWQLALGFAMIGELGAIYFTIYNRKPFLSGVFFALAFGNRTEILLTAPIFIFLLLRVSKIQTQRFESGIDSFKTEIKNLKTEISVNTQHVIRSSAAFCLVPFVLGTMTLLYNYARFNSFTDFGYARIPGVLDEPWYNHGIFSIWYIPNQAYEMLLKLWEVKTVFPYFVPDGFSSSILLTSPFLFFLPRFGARDKILKYAAWAAIFVLTFLLWIHGNSGGWQFGYRYAMILLPWMFLILLENSPKKISVSEWVLFIFSILANAYATYLFHWSDFLKF